MYIIDEDELEEFGIYDVNSDSLEQLNKFIDKKFEDRYKHITHEEEIRSRIILEELNMAKKEEDDLREIITGLVKLIKKYPDLYNELQSDKGLNKRFKRQKLKYK